MLIYFGIMAGGASIDHRINLKIDPKGRKETRSETGFFSITHLPLRPSAASATLR